jgi:hypothetical protein
LKGWLFSAGCSGVINLILSYHRFVILLRTKHIVFLGLFASGYNKRGGKGQRQDKLLPLRHT